MQDFSWLSRTELLVGREKLEEIANKHVLIVGLGGVGSFAAEAIARGGVGNITIIDGDEVEASNRNRQLVALTSTDGVNKADVMAERILEINLEVNLTVIKQFMNPEDMEELMDENSFDYVMDCIDSVTPKIKLIASTRKKGLKLVSSMGAGGKMDPTQVKVADLEDSYNCKLAHYMRKRLHRLGIRKGFPVVFSSELPLKSSIVRTDGSNFKRSAYGTCSYMPAVFGLTCASVVLRDFSEWKSPKS